MLQEKSFFFFYFNVISGAGPGVPHNYTEKSVLYYKRKQCIYFTKFSIFSSFAVLLDPHMVNFASHIIISESHFIQGVLPNGQIFDTSMKDSQRPFRFQLGSGNVIKGWERGIQGMCPG